MNISAFFLTCIALFTAGNTTLCAQDANDILEKHRQAMGGTAAWDKVTSLKLKCTKASQNHLISKTTKGTSQERMVEAQDAPQNKAILTIKPGMSLHIDDESQEDIQHYNVLVKDNIITFVTFTKTDTMSLDEVNAYWPVLYLEANLLLSPAAIANAVYEGMEAVNDIPCYKLKITGKTGLVTTCNIDKATGYLLRTQAKIHYNGKDKATETNYSDYTKTDSGLILPMYITTSSYILTIENAEINVTVDDKIFKPEATETK